MKHFRYRGKRIRPADKDLMFRSACCVALPVSLAVFALLNLKSILQTDWRRLSMLGVDGIDLNMGYLMFSGIVAAVAAGAVLVLLYRLFPDTVRQLRHRQKLARMVLENQWYEQAERTKQDGFFKDLPRADTKPKIARFPRMYYRMENGLLHFQVEITMGKYQEPLLHLETKLESGLYCELVSRELRDGYVEYTLLYDMVANRIPIAEAKAEGGRLRLMKNVWWEYDTLPHMLIAGGTGGGKTYFILTIIQALLQTDAVLHILDPKNADLADLSAVMPEVYYRKEDIAACVSRFCDGMMQRSESMKSMQGYKTGENYAYIGLEPHFLIFDEYVAFMEMLNTREREDVLNRLKQIVMLGRQAGYFLILACQRPDAKYLGDGIRDQFNFRVALGRMSELGYSMMFGEVKKEFFFKNVKGRGYADTGKGVITEFYTPVVPKGYDFLREIGTLAAGRRFAPIMEVDGKTMDNDDTEDVIFDERYD
ncbi:FtsK/SpoIIIE domain-containing protein [Agathobaculum sp. Marseille-P7918]|uniref:FtsK/SpoIIIE domain-containing protein n=1 Tax=Agathobaculum sp. Marseille-P7918 TaxID=2479843 RepID=UPI003568E5F1